MHEERVPGRLQNETDTWKRGEAAPLVLKQFKRVRDNALHH